MRAREALSDRFDILERSFLTNLKKSKDFLQAKEEHEKTKTKQISETHQSVEILERWVSVLNYCDYLQNTLNFRDYSNCQTFYFQTMLDIFNNYDYSNTIKFKDLDMIEKILENRDTNNLTKFIHHKNGVKHKYQYFPDPGCLKNKIRFNYLDD